MENLRNCIIDKIQDKLEEFKDMSFYGSDLAYSLFEEENINCTFTYDDFKSKFVIKKYFEDISGLINDCLDSEYIFTANPFTESEKFLVQIVLEMASKILSQCELIKNNWDNELELTKENIEILNKNLDDLRDF